MKQEQYKGYEAYDYLEKGVDFKPVKTTPGEMRVSEALVPLTPEQEARLAEVREKYICIGIHDHPELMPDQVSDLFKYLKSGRRNIAYGPLSRGYYDCVIDSVGGSVSKMMSNAGFKFEEYIYDLGMRLCDIAHQDFVVHCKSVSDIWKAWQDGKMGWIAGMESAACIENELDRLDVLYGLGLRQIGITYSTSNCLGTGGQDIYDAGLTGFGRKAVKRMNQLGLLIDCAHSSTRTIIDTAELSQTPILLSHIGARALRDNKRMATDEALKAVADNGGLIGVETAPHTTMVSRTEPHSFHSVIEHFEYIRDLVGIDHVTFGPDSMYGDHVAFHNASGTHVKNKDLEGYVRCEYVAGAENPTEVSKNIVRYLVSRNYCDGDIEKVMGGNLLRILKKTWIG